MNKRNPLSQYFADVWAGVVTTWLGMKLTLRYCVGKPVTMLYPEERPVVPRGYRGIHVFDEHKCSVCRGCAAACPVDCITIEALGRGKDVFLTRFDIDYSKCLFCDLCTPPCPTEAILMGREFDLAGYTRDDMIVKFARPKTPAEIARHEAYLAQKEAEKKAKLEAAKAADAKKKAEAEKAKAEAEAKSAGEAQSAGETNSNTNENDVAPDAGN
jgi:NADH-quinone oxidoreductase subunit I